MNADKLKTCARLLGEFLEDQWFDRTRNIQTSGNVTLGQAGIAPGHQADSELYQPARPRHIRQALRELAGTDLSDFTYIDLGSGKGRGLFVAAEFGFKRIVGVEFSPLLQEQACANLARFRNRHGQRQPLESLHANALNFVFPEGRLVLYLFNPFGRATMETVLKHLEASLRGEPRDVIVVLLWPRCGDLVAAIEGMRLIATRKEYQVFAFKAGL